MVRSEEDWMKDYENVIGLLVHLLEKYEDGEIEVDLLEHRRSVEKYVVITTLSDRVRAFVIPLEVARAVTRTDRDPDGGRAGP